MSEELFDQKFVQKSGKVVNCILLSILWAVFSVPVFTIGASSAALIKSCGRTVLKDEGYVWRTFFDTFRSRFKKTTLLWLAVLALETLLYLDLRLILALAGQNSLWHILTAFCVMMMLFAGSMGIYALAQAADLNLPVKETLRNAVLLVFCEKDPLHVTCAAIYGATMVLLYTVSTLYHALGLNRAKVVFRSLDHCTIFLLIAGTYTPITLVCLGGVTGWAMFAVVWAAAVLGVVLNAISVERFKVVSMICYLAMGWVVVLAMGTFRQNVSAAGFWCLLSGGICYTVGAVLYGLGKKLPYIHGVFHLFVLAGSVLHTISVYGIVA